MLADEKTFRDELIRIIDKVLQENKGILLSRANKEKPISKGDTITIQSNTDHKKVILFEIKPHGWDATDETLVRNASLKAISLGYESFVTITPRQIALYETFREDISLYDRKLKTYQLSNILKNEDIPLSSYEKEITPNIKRFLTDLSDVFQNKKDTRWDSIDTFFANKLSSYILEASARMYQPMFAKISNNNEFRNSLKGYLKSQDIFNVSLSFYNQDIYKICQLSSFLLYLKIVIYTSLQRDVKNLNLKPLEIPEDNAKFHKVINERFGNAAQNNYETIFKSTALDEFEFEKEYIPTLKYNIEQIKSLNLHELNIDIIGNIYNTLIDNQEQHEHGQHFTNTNEVDIVNGFCINADTKNVLDSGCGAGTFLVRAYHFLKTFHPKLSHQELLKRVWGVEIAQFPALLATMNIQLLSITNSNNQPNIINADFSKLNSNTEVSTDNSIAKLNLPIFDACIGNPPYIRQEFIENKTEWSLLADRDFGVKKVNKQSDLYVYYLMHTVSFLKEGGRLGYVIAASWLDISYGSGLQKFLLDHFKIVAIIDHQKKRSFQTASVNTIILIIEKCSDKQKRDSNNVKFVRLHSDYESIINESNPIKRVDQVIAFAKSIERTTQNTQNNLMSIQVVNQKNLELQSTTGQKYTNGYWGAKYLRSPEILDKIAINAKDSFIPLSQIATVKYGIKTGANEFFYLIDDTSKALSLTNDEYIAVFGVSKQRHLQTWESCGWFLSELNGNHFIIEREYIKPLFKTQKEAVNLDIDVNSLKYCVLYCNRPKSELSENINKYITLGESTPYEIHKRPSVKGRKYWYDITSICSIGDFIFPSKIGEKYRLIDNRTARVFCDKVNYIIDIKEEYKHLANEVFLTLNSITFRFFIDLYARQLTGSQTLSDVDVNLVSKTLVLHPQIFKKNCNNTESILRAIKSREQQPISAEINYEDKFSIDSVILNSIGLTDTDVQELYLEASNYVKKRQEKSDSIRTSKTKQKITYNEALMLVKDRFATVLKYNNLTAGMSMSEIKIPEDIEFLYTQIKAGSTAKNKKKVISTVFTNQQQAELIDFFCRTLEIKNTQIPIPINAEDCLTIHKKLKSDFDQNINQIKGFLKSKRCNANHISIYRDLILT